MTITETFQPPAIPTVTLDLYRDIHKGIRTQLFDLVELAGRTDPSDCAARRTLADAVTTAMTFLESHAHHEDTAIDPVLHVHLPALAERIVRDHALFDGRAAYLVDFAEHLVEDVAGHERALLHQLYLDLAGFTSIYLVHQDVEEREIMPALEAAVGPAAVAGIHGQILASIPPDQMARSLALMLPAMNLDDRSEMLGGIREHAPAEAFQGVWGLAGSVLDPADHTALARRLGLA
ncbi:MAG: hypothetical protein JWO77_3142 [Ilumatobacteraceae bacterium]|nr:hypothetical protein [Ilumatobacteraceae bacterium]